MEKKCPNKSVLDEPFLDSTRLASHFHRVPIWKKWDITVSIHQQQLELDCNDTITPTSRCSLFVIMAAQWVANRKIPAIDCSTN